MSLIMLNTKPCMVCGERGLVEVEAEDYTNWKNGMFAQTAFPYLGKEEREMIISGTHGACWTILFANDEDAE